MHALSEKTHGGGKSKPAKPAEGLLRTVREEDHAKDKTKNGDGWIVRGVDEFAEDGHAPLLFRRENQDLRKRRCYTDFAGWWTRKRQTGGSGGLDPASAMIARAGGRAVGCGARTKLMTPS